MKNLDALVANEASWRLAVFGGLLIVLLIVERVCRAPDRDSSPGRLATNFALVLLGTLTIRVLFPVLAVGLALRMRADGFGAIAALQWPLALEIPLAVVLLDMAIYWQHRLMHRVPALWRLHRVHHSDLRVDVTTGLRFHPLELAFSMLVKLGLIAVLAPNPAAVVLFELLLSAGSLLTHAALVLPPRVDRALRLLVVTPAMHRIHHSVEISESDSNFGFHLSIWDRLFHSYRAHAARPDASIRIGLTTFRSRAEQTLGALLMQPFRQIPPATGGQPNA